MSDAGDRTSAVLVTGGAGFIGSALCHRLRSAMHRVIVYDDLSRGSRDYLPDDVEFVRGDIRDTAAVKQVITDAKPDVVIHLAAMHFIPDCIARPEEARQVNVEGTRRVLDSCRSTAVRRFIFASTAAVYAPGDAACVEDTTPLGPLEVYGESKLEGEGLVRTFHDETGITTTILRLFNAIGRHETNAHVLPHIFTSLQRSDVVSLGNTAPRRDYIDTREIADAILAVMRLRRGFDIFNVGTAAAYSVDDILTHLRRLLEREISVVHETGRMRSSDRMLLRADISHIQRRTGWTPRMTLDNTLRDLVEAYGLRRGRHA